MDENIIKEVLKVDEIWNTRRDNKYSWGRMFYIYFHIFVLRKSYKELLINKVNYNQFYYLVYKSKDNLKKNQYYKFLYLRILDKMIQKSFN